MLNLILSFFIYAVIPLNLKGNNRKSLKEMYDNNLVVSGGLSPKQNPVSVYVSSKSFIERSWVRGVASKAPLHL